MERLKAHGCITLIADEKVLYTCLFNCQAIFVIKVIVDLIRSFAKLAFLQAPSIYLKTIFVCLVLKMVRSFAKFYNKYDVKFYLVLFMFLLN